ncbi:hypothetical protein AA105894_1615 [Asaia spathodeae NBRC 105894]|nr:hypothetical protein AA105894_1615 [Asaia spathodeae NBRC 105894]
MLGGRSHDEGINLTDQRLQTFRYGATCFLRDHRSPRRIRVEKGDESLPGAVSRLEGMKPSEMSGPDNSDLKHLFSWLLSN